MKKSLVFITCLLASYFSIAQSVNEIKLKPEIKNITVFLNGSEIKHIEEISLLKGRNTIIVSGLSSAVADNSIQASILDAEILSVKSILKDAEEDELSEGLLVLVKKKKQYEQEYGAINDKINAYKAQLDLLVANREIVSVKTGEHLQNLQSALDFHFKHIVEINESIAKLDVKRDEKKEELKLITDQLDEMRYDMSKTRKMVKVDVLSSSNLQTKLKLRYIVNQTGWAPSYDIIAGDITKPIVIKYRAHIYNNSGVDWNNVKLTLSTADPTLDANKPALSAWKLNYTSQFKSGRFNNYQSNAYLRNDPAKEPNYKTIAIDKLGIEFEIEKQYDIIADANPYLVDIKSHSVPASFSYYAVPKIDKDAFLMASITDWEKLKLIDGPANIYFGDNYVGRSEINTQMVEDTLPISLGRDKQVLVTRTLEKDFTSKKFIGTNRKDEYTYKIIVKNNRTAPIQIEVVDQVPVSGNSDIEVEVKKKSQAELNETTGELKWLDDIEPGGSKVYELTYSIKYPKNKRINNNKKKSVRMYSF